jgi:hypothetical protein
MPIKQLKSDDMGLPRAGVIRLGYKTRKCQNDKCGYILQYQDRKSPNCPKCQNELGKEFPTEAGHFILDDAPGVFEAIGTDTPTELKVFFPFDDIGLIFPNFMQAWQASALMCRGDGEHIVYAINPTTGKVKVRDGIALYDFDEVNFNGKVMPHKTGEVMPCPGPERNYYSKCRNCKPNAMLIVMLRDVPRMAYWQISTTSIHNIIDLQKQLNTVKGIVGQITGTPRLSGIPFILKRVKRTISVPKTDRAGAAIGRQRVDKWFVQLEIEPDWVVKMIAATRRNVDPIQYAIPAHVDDIIQASAPIADTFIDPPQWEQPVMEDAEFYEEELPAIVEPVKAISAPQAPTPKPAPTNGGHTDKPKPYRFPSNAAQEFYSVVQQHTNSFYANPEALLEVIGGWFNFMSEDIYKEKLSQATDYARNVIELQKLNE